MAQFVPNITAESLAEKVILITGMNHQSWSSEHYLLNIHTGGANGIGASLVELCCENGAYVCFGDIAADAGDQVAQKLSASSSSKPRAVFRQTDVMDYKSILSLFDAALETYGHIDHVVAAAGIQEIGNWFDPALTLEDVREVCH